jgi:hypothetical protein
VEPSPELTTVDSREPSPQQQKLGASGMQSGLSVAPVARRLLTLQRSVGNQAVLRLLQRQASHSDVSDIRRQLDSVDTQWDEEYGVYWWFNGMSKERMVEVYNRLTPGQRKKLEDNLDKTHLDRARMYQGIQQAKAGGTWWRAKSDQIQWAIRQKNFTSFPDGAYWLINPLNDTDRARIMSFLDRDDLDELLAHRVEAIQAGVPNAKDIGEKAQMARSGRKATAAEKSISDLIPSEGVTATGKLYADVRPAFQALAKLNDIELLRTLRALPSGQLSELLMYDDQLDGLGLDANRMRHFLQRAYAPDSSLEAREITQAVYQAEYKHIGNDYSRIMQLSSPSKVFMKSSIDVSIDEITDDTMPPDEVDRQWAAATLGRGGLKWPGRLNRSTVPNLWSIKQSVIAKRNELGWKDVLLVIDAYQAVEWVLFAPVGVVQAGGQAASAIRRPRVMGPFGTGGRMPSSTLDAEIDKTVTDLEAGRIPQGDPAVKVPVRPGGEPAQVGEIGAGPRRVDLGIPPEKELVAVTRTDISPAGAPDQILNAELPLPENLHGKFDTMIINNPYGYYPNVEELSKGLTPNGKIILQGNWNANKFFRSAAKVEVPGMKVTVERGVQPLGRGFSYTDPARPGAPVPDSRITIEFKH